MNDVIKTIEHRGKTIKIYPDHDAESPRDWDNLGTMQTWHRRYDFSDPLDQQYVEYKGVEYDLSEPEDMLSWLRLKAAANELIYLIVRGYDHGGMTINAFKEEDQVGYPYNDRWDSGVFGVIFCTREAMLKEWGGSRLTKTIKEKARRCLYGEIEALDTCLTGGVVGYVISGLDDDTFDSCWGYYDMDIAIEDAKDVINYEVDRQEARDRAILAAPYTLP